MSILEIPGISYFSVLKRIRQFRRIRITVLETRLKTEETYVWIGKVSNSGLEFKCVSKSVNYISNSKQKK
jgi:hypothetical protein